MAVALRSIPAIRDPLPGGLLSNVFCAVGEDWTRGIEVANQNFKDAQNRIQEKYTRETQGYERYKRFEGVLEDSYRSRGLDAEYECMDQSKRDSLIEAASAVYNIHETAQQAREEFRSFGQTLLEEHSAGLDRTLETALARFKRG